VPNAKSVIAIIIGYGRIADLLLDVQQF